MSRLPTHLTTIIAVLALAVSFWMAPDALVTRIGTAVAVVSIVRDLVEMMRKKKP